MKDDLFYHSHVFAVTDTDDEQEPDNGETEEGRSFPEDDEELDDFYKNERVISAKDLFIQMRN